MDISLKDWIDQMASLAATIPTNGYVVFFFAIWMVVLLVTDISKKQNGKKLSREMPIVDWPVKQVGKAWKSLASNPFKKASKSDDGDAKG